MFQLARQKQRHIDSVRAPATAHAPAIGKRTLVGELELPTRHAQVRLSSRHQTVEMLRAHLDAVVKRALTPGAYRDRDAESNSAEAATAATDDR